MKVPDQTETNQEEQGAIKATEARLHDHIQRLWYERVSEEEKREVGKQMAEARQRHRETGWYEALQHQREWSGRYWKEFDSLLWEEGGNRIRPESYLALLKLSGAQEKNVERKALDEEAEELNCAIREVEFRGEILIDESFPWILETGAIEFVFRSEDLPYLRRGHINVQKRLAKIRARSIALAHILGSYERHGERAGNPWGALPEIEGMKLTLPSQASPPLTALEGRGLDYYGVVMELVGQSFDSLTSYAKAIADRCPKPDGDTPSYQAVLDWMGRQGHRKSGDGLEESRASLEEEAHRVLHFLHARGYGQAGNPPDVST